MNIKFCLFALPLALSACAVPTGPVEVTRYRLSEAGAALGHGTIAVVAGPGMEASSTDLQSFEIAVETILPSLGYTAASPDSADQIAQVRVLRETTPAPTNRVGFGASAGSFGSSAGVGIAIPLGASAQTATDLIVVIRERASGRAGPRSRWPARHPWPRPRWSRRVWRRPCSPDFRAIRAKRCVCGKAPG
jgi:hypothetical protein